MKNRNLPATIVIAVCSLLCATESQGQQALIRLLKSAHLPTGRLEQAIFPFNTGITANKPTGIKQRLMAMYYMSAQDGQFVRLPDSVRYFRPQYTGSNYDYPNGVMSIFLYAQTEEPYNPTVNAGDITDSVISYGVTGNVFSQYTNKQTSTLNSLGLITEQVTRVYDIGTLTWTNASRLTYTYNAAKQATIMIKESWVNNAWLPTMKTTCVYDAAGRLTNVVNALWSNDESTWKDSDRHTYTFDVNGNWISDVYQNWNSEWQNNNQVTFTYDASNRRTETTTQQWSGTAWVNNSKMITWYNGAGFRSEDRQTQWDSGLNDWKNMSRRLYSYDANNQQNSTATDMWDGVSNWVTSSRYEFVYAGGKIEQMINKSWINNTWDTAGRFKVDFDANMNGIMLTDETWNNATHSYQSIDGDFRFMFFYEDYEEALSVKDVLPDLNIAAYPNPAKGYLEVQLKDQKIKQISITDIRGKTVYSSKSAPDNNNVILPVDYLSDGIYTLRISTLNGTGSKMFVMKH